MASFLSCDREQVLLLPPDLREWLPAGHLAWFVIDAVAALDLDAVYGDYRADGHGRPAHDPAMMVALVLYAYAVGVRSSRQIERRCHEDVAFRVLSANRAPDHATIARFLARHREALGGLFTQVLAMCGRAGLGSVGVVAVDGTKLAANASLDANRSYAAIREEVERMLAEGAEVDAREDELYGERRGDELPDEWADPVSRRARLERIRRELEREEAERQAAWQETERRRAEHRARTGKNPRGRPPTPPAEQLASQMRNTTDPESRMMRHRGMAIQGYNAQVVANEHQVVLAAEITNARNDERQLEAMIDAVREELAHAGLDARIETVLADTGYWNTAAIRSVQADGPQVLIPTADPQRRAPRRYRPKQGPEAEQINAILDTPEGQALYRRRQVIVEPVFARTRHHRQITRFWRRGLAACRAEWRLINTSHNLLKLYSAALAA
jgi:transposase